MTNELPQLLRTSPASAAIDEFVVYECSNPATDCEHPYLATNSDRSMLMSFGEHLLGFDFELPADSERWLNQDYAATKQHFTLQLGTLRDLIHRTFAGGAIFGFVKFHEDLTLETFELSLREQETADCGPEYVIKGLGNYQRWFRQPDVHTAVALNERALLDVCCPAFAVLGDRLRHLLSAPPTPRYRELAGPPIVLLGDR